jgi:hypothetical protein
MKRKPKPEMVVDGRFAVREIRESRPGSANDPTLVNSGPEVKVRVEPAGSLLEAKVRIEAEWKWRNLAFVMRTVQNLAKVPVPVGRPSLLSAENERLSRWLFDAVVMCADDLPGAMKNAARYVENSRDTISKQGGALVFTQAGSIVPPKPFSLTVIEAACFAVGVLVLERLRRKSTRIELTKGQICRHWERQEWIRPGDSKPASPPSEGTWTATLAEIGLSDLRRSPPRLRKH